jgi:hypothetical protein
MVVLAEHPEIFPQVLEQRLVREVQAAQEVQHMSEVLREITRD